MVRKYFFPVMLSVFLVAMVVMFIFGDLGVVASYKKIRQVHDLQDEINYLKEKAQYKKRLLNRLRKDPATIRHYGLLYGMRGGKKVKSSNVVDDYYFQKRWTSRGRSTPFLIRHPFLILLALTIAVMLVAFVVLNRRKGGGREQAIKMVERRRAEGARYIKPSWN